LLRDVEELSGEQTAAKLNITPSAMKSRLHRARANMRRYMDTVLVPAISTTADSRHS
jgi:DNA-directed RNA polymerase specialized sigma24 family protein